MLTLERWGRRSIYSLEGRRGTRASAPYCAQTGGAGCPSLPEGPDVRAGGLSFWMSCSVAPDVRASGRISGLGPDVRGLSLLSGWEAAEEDGPGA